MHEYKFAKKAIKNIMNGVNKYVTTPLPTGTNTINHDNSISWLVVLTKYSAPVRTVPMISTTHRDWLHHNPLLQHSTSSSDSKDGV